MSPVNVDGDRVGVGGVRRLGLERGVEQVQGCPVNSSSVGPRVGVADEADRVLASPCAGYRDGTAGVELDSGAAFEA